MRRLVIEEPYSVSAIWSRRLAVFSGAVSLMAVALARSRAVGFSATMAVFASALLIACLAILLASAAAVVIWRTGRRGVGVALAASCLAALVLGYPAYLAVQAIRLPELNDVSTDLINPPDFSRSAAALAARDGYIYPALPQSFRNAQQRAYPDVQPIVVDLDASETYRLARRAALASGWRIVATVPPGGRMGLGHIDAVAHSFVMGFPQDITIRIEPLAGQTRLDVRAASRYGRHDFGSDARRIDQFSNALQAQLDAQ